MNLTTFIGLNDFFLVLKVANVCLYSRLHGNAVEDGNTVYHLEAVHSEPIARLGSQSLAAVMTRATREFILIISE